MVELSWQGWVVVAFCAMMVGVTKTGLPGIGILTVPLMAMVMPARSSVGVLLGILILADLFAAAYHRKNAQWGHIVRLLPIAFAGIITGYYMLDKVSDEQLQPIIGVIVLLMLAINYWRDRKMNDQLSVPNSWWFIAGMGFLAGVTTMMANAAGPVMVIYMMSMKLDKFKFMGTTAWFFFVINWLKVPFSAHLDLMTLETVKFNLMMLPFILLGAVLGVVILKKIPQKVFLTVVQVLAAAAAVKLLF